MIIKRFIILPAFIFLLVSIAGGANAASPRQAILDEFSAQARQADQNFKNFSAKRGQELFLSKHSGGKKATPGCTTCHTKSPLNVGKTRAGKAIDPMAVSRTPTRYTDAKKVAKWFRRNCKSVLGRECTAKEKGDYITFMISQ